ncbi:unnamed protein product, partial [Vitis vinifera]
MKIYRQIKIASQNIIFYPFSLIKKLSSLIVLFLQENMIFPMKIYRQIKIASQNIIFYPYSLIKKLSSLIVLFPNELRLTSKAADLISSSHWPLFILHSSSFINPTFFTLPMADTLVSIVLERLTSVVEQQIHEQVSLASGVESEIQSLKNTLLSVRDVLEDAERRKVKEKSVQGWLERLKDMAYEMMDVLDEWSIAIFQFQMEGVENASTSKTKRSKFK